MPKETIEVPKKVIEKYETENSYLKEKVKRLNTCPHELIKKERSKWDNDFVRYVCPLTKKCVLLSYEPK